MVQIIAIRQTYADETYLPHACTYVREKEQTICRGGYGVDPFNLNHAYEQMMAVKQYFSKTSGNPLMHFIERSTM